MDYAQLLDLSALSQAFSSNMYVSALVMILLNVGTSYLMQDLMPIAHRIFSVLWVRRLVFFAIFFTATRDLKVSLLLMIVFTLLVDVFLNEHSDYCLIPYEHRMSKPQQPGTAPLPSHPNRHTTETFQVEARRSPQLHTLNAPPHSRLERFRRNARQWSVSRRPIAYW